MMRLLFLETPPRENAKNFQYTYQLFFYHEDYTISRNCTNSLVEMNFLFFSCNLIQQKYIEKPVGQNLKKPDNQKIHIFTKIFHIRQHCIKYQFFLQFHFHVIIRPITYHLISQNQTSQKYNMTIVCISPALVQNRLNPNKIITFSTQMMF